jgi:hypothetical protein
MSVFPDDLLGFFFVMVVANAADRYCEEQGQMIDRALCISRRIFSLLTPVLSPVDFF